MTPRGVMRGPYKCLLLAAQADVVLQGSLDAGYCRCTSSYLLANDPHPRTMQLQLKHRFKLSRMSDYGGTQCAFARLALSIRLPEKVHREFPVRNPHPHPPNVRCPNTSQAFREELVGSEKSRRRLSSSPASGSGRRDCSSSTRRAQGMMHNRSFAVSKATRFLRGARCCTKCIRRTMSFGWSV